MMKIEPGIISWGATENLDLVTELTLVAFRILSVYLIHKHKLFCIHYLHAIASVAKSSE